MAINLISRGVLFNFIFNLIIVYVLLHYQFELNTHAFTTLLFINLIIISFFIGASSKKNNTNSVVNGMFVGVGSAMMILIFVSLFTDMDMNTNIFLCFAWTLIACFSSLLGAIVSKRKK